MQYELDLLKQGVEAWNQWREREPYIQPDLSRMDFSGSYLYRVNFQEAYLYETRFNGAHLSWANLKEADLREADLSKAILFDADLSGAVLNNADFIEANLQGVKLSKAILNRTNLYRADLQGANLRGADLREALFRETKLRDADLRDTDLRGADLNRADLTSANLAGANLTSAKLVGSLLVNTSFVGADLTNCWVYGIAAWDIQLEGAKQESLVITRDNEPTITVDNLKVAQFIYLLLNNQEIRDVIDTIAKKAVLILGRFTPPKRKAVLDAIREALRTHGYLPILFDFDKPASRDITETVSILAHLSRFVIADITDAKSIPQELMIIVPNLPSVPVQPLILESQREYSMFEHFKKFPWVLATHSYRELEDLLASLEAKVIEPAEQKAQELEKR